MHKRNPAFVAALAGCLATSCSAQSSSELPMRRAGLWESKLTAGFGGATSVVQSCVDPEADRRQALALQSRTSAGAADCKGMGPMTKTADGWSFHQVCQSGPSMKVEFDGKITGDYSTRYTTTMVQRMIPPPVPEMAKTTSVTESRWLGPCPAGMKPGANTVNGQPGAQPQP